ncbi:cytochrome D1 domain-containing protein [Aliamphritea hakodatensis]|uniref:cytochrome D1 domain-containing protein n=1 Tax=Aliamphritea hakodatensis TaxID=2895352 RepID=UPI0022FD7849|nr:cytochrome D1 domain-containing protein [Aliamphritea hakodatensis]
MNIKNWRRHALSCCVVPLLISFASVSHAAEARGTGDLGVIIERATGSVQVVEHTGGSQLYQVEGLGDLSHASIVFSRDERFAYVFGRDGGLTKVDILSGKIDKRVLQGGNSIGGAISEDGTLVAVSNYEPGGVKIFNARTLALVADIPAVGANGVQSKVVGLVDAPDNRFVFSLYESDEIWIADVSEPATPQITKFTDIGRQPYDALITPDGRYYIAGLFGEDGMALVDLWYPEKGARRILDGYGRGEEKLPVYKMPHLEGWAIAGDYAFVPAVGHNQVIVVDRKSWQQVGKIPVHGQPIFVMARPGGRHMWVNFAYPNNDTLQVIDTESQEIIQTLKPGKAVLHMEFTPKGDKVWASVRDDDQVQIYDTKSFEKLDQLPVEKPSGIFFTNRAHTIGL